MQLVVEPMDVEDIPEVLEVDRESYTLPWPANAYRREIMNNRNARYLVLRELPEGSTRYHEPEQRPWLPFPFLRKPREEQRRPGRIIGYAGMWLMVDEAHVTTIAIRSAYRGNGLGELLLASLIELAGEMGAQRVTLEVRVSNFPAQNLYRKYGFTEHGVRPRYYSDNNEDAYIMTTGNIQESSYTQAYHRLVDQLRHRLLQSGQQVSAPAFPETVHHAEAE